jgi:hypothetical protein
MRHLHGGTGVRDSQSTMADMGPKPAIRSGASTADALAAATTAVGGLFWRAAAAATAMSANADAGAVATARATGIVYERCVAAPAPTGMMYRGGPSSEPPSSVSIEPRASELGGAALFVSPGQKRFFQDRVGTSRREGGRWPQASGLPIESLGVLLVVARAEHDLERHGLPLPHRSVDLESLGDDDVPLQDRT